VTGAGVGSPVELDVFVEAFDEEGEGGGSGWRVES